MRLVQTLAKAVVILAVIAATLGGAVALGSTLFESPPRDAAEFAARVEAGSTYAPPAETRTAAERRYILAVGELCAERNEQVHDLEERVPAADSVGRLRGWRRRHDTHAPADRLAVQRAKRASAHKLRAASRPAAAQRSDQLTDQCSSYDARLLPGDSYLGASRRH